MLDLHRVPLEMGYNDTDNISLMAHLRYVDVINPLGAVLLPLPLPTAVRLSNASKRLPQSQLLLLRLFLLFPLLLVVDLLQIVEILLHEEQHLRLVPV